MRNRLSKRSQVYANSSFFSFNGKFADNIFIHEGIGDIDVERVREVVHQHISITGQKPVVLIDYLQILSPADVRATDKKNTDKAVIELKRLSRDFKF